MTDIVYIDVRTSALTLGELMAEISRLSAEHPDQDVHMDGDLYAVTGRVTA